MDDTTFCIDALWELFYKNLLGTEDFNKNVKYCEITGRLILKETLIKSCHAIWRPLSRLAALSDGSISPASPTVTRLARRENDSPSDVTAFSQHFLKAVFTKNLARFDDEPLEQISRNWTLFGRRRRSIIMLGEIPYARCAYRDEYENSRPSVR